jgi:hypothetical protein
MILVGYRRNLVFKDSVNKISMCLDQRDMSSIFGNLLTICVCQLVTSINIK